MHGVRVRESPGGIRSAGWKRRQESRFLTHGLATHPRYVMTGQTTGTSEIHQILAISRNPPKLTAQAHRRAANVSNRRSVAVEGQ